MRRVATRRAGNVLALATVAMAVIAACDGAVDALGGLPAFPGAPAAVAMRPAIPFCGTEDLRSPEGASVAARQCLWEAWQAHEAAEFVSTMSTLEGDPITWIYRVRAEGGVEVFVDSTRDRWSAMTWTRMLCPELALDTESPVQPSFGLNGDCTETTLR